MGISIAESECHSRVRAELLLNPLDLGQIMTIVRFSLTLQRAVLKWMNEWQHECFRESHDDEIF